MVTNKPLTAKLDVDTRDLEQKLAKIESQLDRILTKLDKVKSVGLLT